MARCRVHVAAGSVASLGAVILLWWYAASQHTRHEMERDGVATAPAYLQASGGSPDMDGLLGNQSLVFVHIQKTGGSTFMSHVVTLKRNGVPLCTDTGSRAACSKPHSQEGWLIAKRTVGWMHLCCVHPFYSELKSCLTNELNGLWGANPHRQLVYFTLLRHPVLRYISEYLHVQREATWSVRHTCGGKAVTNQEMPPCYPGYYQGDPWRNVTLERFLSCSSNWAANRQTLALASLEEAGCFQHLLDQSQHQRMLETAKDNLRAFGFFGLTEHYEESVVLFEKTFDVEFGEAPEQRGLGQLHSTPLLQDLWGNTELYQRVAQANQLDMELYQFAVGLFASRLAALGLEIDTHKVDKDVGLLTEADKESMQRKHGHLNFDLPQ